MGELTPQQQQALTKAHEFYPGHDGAVGVFQAEGIPDGLLKSGVEGGPWGGTQRGGIPRGEGYGFTQGGPSQGNVSTHVEGHAAAIMWQRKLTTATLVVDRAMCGICSRDLSAALPPGSTLFVVSESEGRTIVRSSHASTEPPPPLTGPSTGGGGSGGAPGGGGGLPPGVKTIQLDRITPGKGAANAGAALAVFQIIDTLSNYLSDKYLADEVKGQILIVTSQIRAHQQKNPSDGALVAITFSRVRPNDDFGVIKNTVLIHPGDTFQYINVYFDTTPKKATVRLEAPAIRQDLGPNSPYKLEWSVNRYWVNPVQPAFDSPAGKWRVRVPPWLWIYEFDEQGGVRWTDPFNQETGKGKWRIKGDQMVLSWDPPSSTTKESWDFPLVPTKADGRGVMSGRNFSLTAEKQPY